MTHGRLQVFLFDKSPFDTIRVNAISTPRRRSGFPIPMLWEWCSTPPISTLTLAALVSDGNLWKEKNKMGAF